MKHCLVVDDSRVIRMVARRILEGLSYSVAEAEDGMAALRVCREKMPDVILLDWSMPGMAGVELVRAIRAEPGGGLPVILITFTEMDAGAIAQGVAVGANDYLMKPFDRETLAAKLAELRSQRAAPPASAAAG